VNRAWDAAKSAGCVTAFLFGVMGVMLAAVGAADKFGGPLGVAVLWIAGVFGGFWLLSYAASGTEARQRQDPEEGLDPKGDGPAPQGDAHD
jgi:hypothetical protein